MADPISATVAFAVGAWTSATAVGATIITTATAGAISGAAASALAGSALKFAISTGLSAAAAALLRPNTPSTGTTLDFKPDPKAAVRGAMGYTAVGGNKAFQATWGYNRVAMSLGVALSLGPIDAITQFQADGAAVTFSGAQSEATGFYAADMWQTRTLGLPGDAALLPPTGLKYGNPGLTGWGVQNAAPQVAFAFWTMVLAKNPEDRDIFTNGVPDPRWIGRWMKVWNPRRDDTYPGGSGPQRRDDWRTWEWSENPYVHALAWYRGHFKLNLDGTIDRTKRIAGIGAPDAALDIPAFVEGMNVADANQWTISGEWASTDPKAQVAMAMLQAGGGQPINRGAQISVLVNMPRVSTYTYTKADLIGQAQIRPLTPRRDRKNTIIPRFKSEANNWEYVAAGEVTDAGYRTEDRGEPRSVEVEYVHVRNAKQAGQLAAYDLVTLREGLTVTLPSKVHLMHVHAGDCITVDEPELAMVGQKFVVMRTTTDYKSATVTLELRSETDAKHAFALGQVSKAPPSPTLSAVDPKYMPPPVAIDWTIAPKPVLPGQPSQPVIIIDGKVETSDVAEIIIEHGPSADGPWTVVYSGKTSIDGRYAAKSLEPGWEYWISIRYVAKNGSTSDRLIDGPHIAPDLTANIAPDAPVLDDIRAEARAKAALLIKEAASRWNRDETDKRFAIENVKYVTEQLAITRETLELADQDQIALLEVERVARIDGITAETTARQLQISGVEDALAIVDDFSRTTATALAAETEVRNTQVSSLGTSIALVDTKATTAVTAAEAAATATSALIAEVEGVQSTVTTHSTAISDLNTQNNIARFDLEVAAGGGRPARVSIVSQASGSDIALLAEQIWFGDNTFWDDVSDTFQTLTAGGRRLVTHGPFGAGGEMLMWLGPASVPAASMSRANADFFIAVNAPRIGGADFPVGGGSSGSSTGRKESPSNSFNTGNTWATVEVLTPSGVPTAPFITANVEWIGAPSVSDTGTWVGELRLIEVASGTVVGGPEAISITHYSEPPGLTLTGPGGASGAVQYALQCRRTSGSNNVTSIGFAINFDAYQRL